MITTVHDPRPCLLGEGPLWHPERQQLFWFDIIANRLRSQTAQGDALEWTFPGNVSAAGWVDHDHLMIGSETGLHLLNIDTGVSALVCPLEADTPANRSNDGRADPFGGFWISTMGKTEAKDAGAIYRWYRGELRQLFAPITIPNAISFLPDRSRACFADTARGLVWSVALDPVHGWPLGEPLVFLDCTVLGVNPDGAVFDAEGLFWCAHWGAGRVTAYDAKGQAVRSVPFAARNTSCPAFGGADLTTLYCTSARKDLDAATIAAEPTNGHIFAAPHVARGLPEYQVVL